jgi:hypothetical protein
VKIEAWTIRVIAGSREVSGRKPVTRDNDDDDDDNNDNNNNNNCNMSHASHTHTA